jgi:starvation-inducible DNA-binding protein
MKLNKDTVSKKLMERLALKEETGGSLVTLLNKLVADEFLFYFQAHTFHWNVEGPMFPEYHAFFGKVYTDHFAVVDPLAEYIRALDSYAPTSLSQIINIASIHEPTGRPSNAQAMFAEIAVDNTALIATIKEVKTVSERAGETNIGNYMDTLLDIHTKLAWMLRSLQKG